MPLRRLRWGLAGALVAWTLIRVLGLERGWPLVPLLAFTPYVAAVALIGAAVAAWRRWWAGALVAGACAAVLIALLAPRAIPDRAPADPQGVRLRVLAVNLAGRYAVGPDMVAALRRWRVDVFAVAELTPLIADGFERAGIAEILPRSVLRPQPDFRGNGLYARAPLRPIDPPAAGFELAAGELRPPGAAPVEVVAVHLEAPTGPSATGRWRRDLRALPPAGGEGPLRVLAGDFNATLDHAELRRLIATGYRDAAERAGRGLQPTWPVGRLLPPGLVTIDHVLADERIRILSARSVELPLTDHRGVLAELLLPRR